MSTTLPEGQERAPGAPDAPSLCAAAAPMAAAPGDRKLFALVALGILVLGASPPLAFWFWVGRVPTLSLREAQAVLARPDSKAALVDVRSPEQYAAGHVPGAVNWPLGEIRKAGEPTLPGSLKDRQPLLVICESGILGASAAAILREKSGLDAWNVEGGTLTWLAAMEPPPRGRTARAPEGNRPPELNITLRESPSYEQHLAVFSGFTLKPTYMLAALVLAWLLRKRREPDLAALRWAMLSFFAGEAFCYANFFCFADESRLVEYLHSYGMAVAAGFGAFALFEGFDRRLIRYSDPNAKCAALPLCGPCAKYADAPCGLKRVFQWLIPAAAALACLPLTASPHAVCYDTQIWAARYNYSHPLIYQIYEIWICPLLALGLLGASWLALLFKGERAVLWAKVLCSAGLGFLSFGYLRLMIFAPYRENLVWFQFWEEATEFIGIAAVALVLWVFRRGLFRRASPGSAEGAA